jgi:multidrug efflux pump subunit AcrA (membrane-fusion protein)
MRFVPSTGRAIRRGVVTGVAAIVVVGFAVTAVWVWGGTSPAAATKTTTAAVKRGTLTVTASASGTVAAIDERALTFGTSGTLATVSVKAGQTVAAGQALATLDSTDAANAVAQARAALTAAQTNLTLAEQQAAAPTATASSTCANARTAAFVVAHPNASASPSATPTSTTSPMPTKTATPTPTHTSTCTTTNNGNTGGNGQGGSQNGSSGTDNLMRAQQSVNNDELTLEQAQEALAGTTIIAPSAGRVLSVGGAVGDRVSGGGSGFIVLAAVNSVAVEASFSEADVAPIKVGQAATVTLANHAGVTYAAKVTQIDPAGTVSGSLVKFGVQLAFVDPPAGLLLGQSATVAVTTDSVTDALYVPAGAVRMSGTASTVTVRTGTTDAVRTVTTGLSGDQGLQVTSGLTQGETVVIRN